MTDYGHPLSFGTVVTPVSARPGSVVDLARLTEAVGLEMVSVPDHVHQPRFLEAWTVLSVVTAHTTRVRLLPVPRPTSKVGFTTSTAPSPARHPNIRSGSGSARWGRRCCG